MPTNGSLRVAVVVPCYNESRTLAPIVQTCAQFGEVLVLDDGSTDGSPEIAKANGGTVIPTGGRTGYDGAVELGLRSAHAQGFDVVITIDADGEHDPNLVADFIKAHQAGAPLVVGIRPKPQRLAEWLVCGYCAWRFGVSDILCGMKGMTRPVLEAYFATGDPNLINTWPTLVWRSQGGKFSQITVTGKTRTDAPRFQSRVRANFSIAAMLPRIRNLPRPADM